MEGGAAAIQVLVQTFIDVSKGEISLIRGLKKNAQKLHNTLTLIHSYLNDADKKLLTEKAVQTWLKHLQDVGFDAHNVLDELNYHDISSKMKSIKVQKKKKKKVAISCFPSFTGYLRRHHVALTINKICICFESSKDDAAYALPEETDALTLDSVFIGRDNDDVLDIVHQMLTSRPTEEPLSVLPIVGMGGFGKTMLTHKVFNLKRIETGFDKRIWIHVSKNFDAVVLLKKILANLISGNVLDESRMVLLEKIRKQLRDKIYLFVLDDVWNEDSLMWEGFRNSLSGITSINSSLLQ